MSDIMRFVSEAHAGPMYGDKPYVYHLVQVRDMLVRYGFSQQFLLDAALLHDVIEDTSATKEDVEALTSPLVADIVDRVTDRPGKNRKERHAKTYPRIRQCVWATTVKLADRISNVENSLLRGGDFAAMYRREYPFFRETLFEGRPELAPMWEQLDWLCA